MSGRQISLWITAGFLIWSSALILAYASHAVGCEFRWSAGTARVVLGAVVLVHGGAIALLLLRAPRGAGLIEVVSRWTLGAGFFALVATFTPGLLLSSCI